MKSTRLDLLMVEKGLTGSRSLAQRLIMAGRVRVDGQVVYKPATLVSRDAELTLVEGERFVSRGGEKLHAAIDAFQIDVESKICADVGAATGGFTDCLLQNGAARVYSIDVARGQLHWKLRTDPRVSPLEGVNARYLLRLPEPVELVVVDASFISLRLLIPPALRWFVPAGGDLITLIKPQFEAGRREASRGRGVIRDPEIHRRVVDEIARFAMDLGLEQAGLVESPLRGPKGNVEFLALFRVPPSEPIPSGK